ncbi:hypothetical protein [Streptomyces sp. NPDC001933]
MGGADEPDDAFGPADRVMADTARLVTDDGAEILTVPKQARA